MRELDDVTPDILEGEDSVDVTLRPQFLTDFVGQDEIKERLHIFIQAAKKRKEPLDHSLFSGPPGLGKTTLATILAHEMGVHIQYTSGPSLERAGDLAAILTNLNDGDVLFIDEIHRLNRLIEESLYPAMEDFQLDIIIGQGPSAKTLKLDLPHFTLVGATTRAGLLTSPLRDRFGIVSRLEYYTPTDLSTIITRSANILNIEISPDGASEIARRSRGTPRIANRLLRRVRDYAQVKGAGHIDSRTATMALKMLQVDERGFDHMDRKILLTIMDMFNGGPVGLETISSAISEEKDTIEDVYEPFLIQCGFINRTPRGRMVTDLAYAHFGRPARAGIPQAGLFDDDAAR